MEAARLTWVGGEDDFALRLGELRALQTALDSGPEEVFNRMRIGTWRADDLIQVIRWGLVGGGMDSSEAALKVTGLFDLHPAFQFKLLALQIVAHSLMGELDESPGKLDGEVPPESGISQASTEPGQ